MNYLNKLGLAGYNNFYMQNTNYRQAYTGPFNQTVNSNNFLHRNGQFYSPSMLNTDAVYTTWQNPNTNQQVGKPLTLIHVNDNHRIVKNLFRFKTAFDQISNRVKTLGNDIIKVHSGDYNIGQDEKKFKLQVELNNKLGIQYAVLGNHEFDIGSVDKLADLLEETQFKTLITNLVVPKDSELKDLIKSNKLVKSVIHAENGTQYGIIGLSPPDLKNRLDPTVKLEGVEVLDIDKTITCVQDEVNKLQAQGINKIILISHTGFSIDQRIAQETDGIDIILGGHSHVLLDPLEPGNSILYSKSSKEPVLIFQNGKNATFFGVTDVQFDQNGVVSSAIARQEKADNFAIDPEMQAIEEKYFGKSPVIGNIKGDYFSFDVNMKENPICNLVAESYRNITGAQIGLCKGTSVRDDIKEGPITKRDVENMLPFVDSTHLLSLSGDDIVKALDNGASTYNNKTGRPGILQVAGLKYTISPDGRATNVMVEESKDHFVPIDPLKEYTVAARNYILKGVEGF